MFEFLRGLFTFLWVLLLCAVVLVPYSVVFALCMCFFGFSFKIGLIIFFSMFFLFLIFGSKE
jgi:hypothetical protein